MVFIQQVSEAVVLLIQLKKEETLVKTTGEEPSTLPSL